MHELNKIDLSAIAGGECGPSEENFTDTFTNSVFTWEKLQAGAVAGAVLGALNAYRYGASPVSYIPFIISGHFAGMIFQAGFKFVNLTKQRMRTGDRTIDPIRDAFCK